MTVSKEVTVPGGSVFTNPSSDHEEVGRYVTLPTLKETAECEEGIGGLGIEVEAILTQSGSHNEES